MLEAVICLYQAVLVNSLPINVLLIHDLRKGSYATATGIVLSDEFDSSRLNCQPIISAQASKES